MFQPLAYLIELNSAVGGLEFMQKNINFFDSNSIYVILLRDQIKSASDIFLEDSRPNVLQGTDTNIIKLVKSPIMERLTNTVFLVLRNDARVDIWGQVIRSTKHNLPGTFLVIFISSQGFFPSGRAFIRITLGHL